MSLNQPIESFRYIGPIYLKKLQRLGIKTLRDLFFHFPHRYDDFSNLKKIYDVKIDEEVAIKGKVKKISTRRTFRKKMFITETLIEDNTGTLRAIWFNQPYLKDTLKEGTLVSLAGKIKTSPQGIFLSNPAYEKVKIKEDLKHTQGLVPVYPETEGLSSRWLRFIIHPFLKKYSNKFKEFLPKEIITKKKLPLIQKAIFDIHFPPSKKEAESAKKRFAFEELFLIQLILQKQKKKLANQKSPKLIPKLGYIEKFKKQLKFTFTADQKKVIREILDDIQKEIPMSRLLEGEVGCGKTIVATLICFITVKNGYQAVIMVPTEILAEQHFLEISKLLKKIDIKIGLLTSERAVISYKNKKEKLRAEKLIEKIKKGEINILIGTHSLIQERVRFKNLGFVVIDEQHRFGVEQRAKLLRDSKIPNVSEFSEKEKIVEKELSYILNGIFFEIQKELGRFCQEKQYSDLLEQKLKKNNLNFQREQPIKINGKKSNFADFIVENKIIIELKVKPFIEKNDYYQISRYLEIKNIELGLIVNFRQKYLKPKRILNPKFKEIKSFEPFESDSNISGRLLPHFLSMTATPIPRTLALAFYSDLSISQIKKLPKGRKKIITKIVPPSKRKEVYKFLRKEVKEKKQAFVICPLIEESEKLEVKAAKKEFERLKTKIFPDLKLGLLHGKMKAKEKEKIMKDFSTRDEFISGGKSKKIQVLVSTPVVEVGIDVPNATIMIIEGADRFGLSQLYQLRGRVGRGKKQSYCFLFTDSISKTTWKRLKAIENAKDAFELAEKDLKIRGPGDFIGKRQSGIPDLTMASLTNFSLIKEAKEEAENLLQEDPQLKKYPLLSEKLKEFKKEVFLE